MQYLRTILHHRWWASARICALPANFNLSAEPCYNCTQTIPAGIDTHYRIEDPGSPPLPTEFRVCDRCMLRKRLRRTARWSPTGSAGDRCYGDPELALEVCDSLAFDDDERISKNHHTIANDTISSGGGIRG